MIYFTCPCGKEKVDELNDSDFTATKKGNKYCSLPVKRICECGRNYEIDTDINGEDAVLIADFSLGEKESNRHSDMPPFNDMPPLNDSASHTGFQVSGCVYSGSYAPPSKWQRFNRWLKGIDYALEDYSNLIKVAGWPIAVLFATLYLLK